jgi:bifunctional oligoribonuclease and PAP phosphatase NrnA
MNDEFARAKQIIDSSKRILLTMHERMDGDDGGALLAMGQQLEKSGKDVTYAIKKGVPPNLGFLPGSKKISDDITHQNFDLIITFGCSSRDRCGSEKIMALEMPILNIDHHPDNTKFGQINVVEAKKSSVAELVYDFFIYNNWVINADVATCLLTGIITDTGSFMHSNTQDSTLKTAAELMSKGANLNKIIRHTFKSKSPQILRAWGKAMENSYYDDRNKIIYSVMTDKDLEEFNSLPQAAFEGFVETLNTVPEAKFAMFLRQDGKIIKGSLRSDIFKDIDVSKIAHIFGGGGHKLAAGFSVAGKLMKDEQGKWKVI